MRLQILCVYKTNLISTIVDSKPIPDSSATSIRLI